MNKEELIALISQAFDGASGDQEGTPEPVADETIEDATEDVVNDNSDAPNDELEQRLNNLSDMFAELEERISKLEQAGTAEEAPAEEEQPEGRFDSLFDEY